ncbi:hypothetical protein NDU88_012924 [Pleurodeles waltl]|uniref:Uncharacterized protein n=1 Tax=Pleurodeles waltl TaxID=8319 RepID=A0AAV7R7H0_PLEWA|nr:hypothetical protein NDU88_012924 [Pleurodeles waltl]
MLRRWEADCLNALGRLVLFLARRLRDDHAEEKTLVVLGWASHAASKEERLHPYRNNDYRSASLNDSPTPVLDKNKTNLQASLEDSQNGLDSDPDMTIHSTSDQTHLSIAADKLQAHPSVCFDRSYTWTG